MNGAESSGVGDLRFLDYGGANIDEITVRQLSEDILAYRHDLDFCGNQLSQANLTPQETRTLQLRVLDLGHQIRHCQHRMETLQIQMRHKNRVSFTPLNGASAAYPSQTSAESGPAQKAIKRQASTPSSATSAPKRPKHRQSPPGQQRGRAYGDDGEDGGAGRGGATPSDADADADADGDDGPSFPEPITSLQRLGFWKCRLCQSARYQRAGSGRMPSAPCKWPLKDVAKMIVHFTEMHGEHAPAERCAELGAALRRNRGPFEYWLRRSRSQDVGDGAIVDECVDELLAGRLPLLLRRLSRAAAGFPAC